MEFFATLTIGFSMLVNSFLAWPLSFFDAVKAPIVDELPQQEIDVNGVSDEDLEMISNQEEEESGSRKNGLGEIVESVSNLIRLFDQDGNPSRYYKNDTHIYEEPAYDGVIVDINGRTGTLPNPEGEKTIVADADPGSFKVLDARLAMDNTHMFEACNDVLGVCSPTSILEGADPKTFEKFNIPNSISPEYAKDSDQLFYTGFGVVDVTPVEGLDFDTLEFVPGAKGFNSYMRDKNGVYITHLPYSQYKKLKGVKPGNFTLLGTSNYVDKVTYYGKDKDLVFYGDQILSSADPVTFEVVKGMEAYDAQDKKYQYANGEVVALAGSTNVGSNYWKNKDGIYYTVAVGSIALEGVNPETFVYDTAKNIGKDGAHVWFEGVPLENADPSTIQQINDWWFKDIDNVYLVGSLNYHGTLYKVDPAQFQPILFNGEPTLYGREGEHIVCVSENEYLTADAVTFEVTGQYSARDKEEIFNGCDVYDPKNP